MRRLVTLFIILLPILAKSQDTVRIPYPVAKQIAKDLIIGDSAVAELKLVQEQLTLTQQKVVLKDSIISSHVLKDTIYEQRIKNEQLKFDTQKIYVGELEKKNKKLKVKLLATKISLGAIVAGMGYLYLTK